MDKQVERFFCDFASEFKLKDKTNLSEEFIQFYNLIRDRIKPGSKYRTLGNVGPIALYIYLKQKRILVPLPYLLEYYHLEYRIFVSGLNYVIRYYSEFKMRNKREIVKSYVIALLKSLQLNGKIIQNALILLDYFYHFFQFTKEEVSAAVICSLTIIVHDIKSINMTYICEGAGISQSSLRKYFIENIFPQIGVINFSTITNASGIIRSRLKLKVKLFKIDRDVLNKIPTPQKRTRLKALSPLTSKVIELRRKRTSIENIARNVDVSTYQVRRILERKLPNYQNYEQ